MNEQKSSPSVMRSIAAVLLGLATIFVLSAGTDIVLYATHVFAPPGRAMATPLWLLSTAYRIVYGVVGCYVAARIAPSRPMRHSMILGAIGVAVGLIGIGTSIGKGPEYGPMWYPIVIALIPIPCAWVAGRLRESQLATASVATRERSTA